MEETFRIWPGMAAAGFKSARTQEWCLTNGEAVKMRRRHGKSCRAEWPIRAWFGAGGNGAIRLPRKEKGRRSCAAQLGEIPGKVGAA
jgi:hypothetical protein